MLGTCSVPLEAPAGDSPRNMPYGSGEFVLPPAATRHGVVMKGRYMHARVPI